MYKFILESEWPGSLRFISFGSSKSKSKPVQLPLWSPEQKQIFQGLWPIAETGLKEPVPAYPKSMYVPKTAEEEAYLAGVPGLADYLGQVRGRLGQPAYQVTPETTEQYYQQAVRAPMMKEWTDVAEPALREAYAGPGYWGSARAEAQTRGAETLATTLGAKRAELLYEEEKAKRLGLETAAERKAKYTPTYATTEAGILGSAGQYSRMIDQEKVTADLQRWLMGEEVEGVTPSMYNPFLQLAFQILGLEPYTYGQKTESSGWNLGILSS